MIAIGSLLLIVALSLLVTRVATVVLTATGLSRETARFQARSAFTGSGFTTGESELVVRHPVRRRVIAALMLSGSVGIVASASTAIIGFRGGALGHAWWRILELAGGLLVLVLLSRNRRVDRWLTALISRVVGRYTDLPRRDVAGLLHLAGDFAVSELAVQRGDWLAARSLRDLDLRAEGVIVLGLTEAFGRYVGVPSGQTAVAAGDVLIVYGSQARLRDLDQRPAGPAGDTAHRAAVAGRMDRGPGAGGAVPDRPARGGGDQVDQG